MENTNEKKIILPEETKKEDSIKPYKFTNEQVSVAEKHTIHFESICNSLSNIIENCNQSISEDVDIDYLQIINSIIPESDYDKDPSREIRVPVYDHNGSSTMDKVYHSVILSDMKIVSIYTDILMNIGETFNLYKIISKKYAKKPIFTERQIQAAGGNPEMVWRLQAQQDMMALESKMTVLDRLICLILYMIGLKDVKDPARNEIIENYRLSEPSDTPVVLLERIKQLVSDILMRIGD